MLVHNYTTKDYSPVIKSCIEKIRFEYNENITLDSLASYVAVTPNYLSLQFHKETGQTITSYIQNERLEHAILLLNSTNDSIQEIAALCGFPDPNYFTRVFKKKKGITPKEYRKNIN
jgi:YesN/AraC family two-component response regulator